jgi:hypothetical protein
MTTPSGQITVADVNTEVGLSPSYSSDLNFLNGKIKPSIRPTSPNMASFQSKNYFQNTTEGNCDNGNCQNNCNCGNIGGDNCFIDGTVNCTNCDNQSYLQPGTNCACTYNCTFSATASHACNCTCACSKIICTKLHEFGMMPYSIFAADQAYGEWLKKNDKVVYRGYIRWAKVVTAWMDGNGPDFMLWINKEERKLKQKESTTKWAHKIVTPWSEHMAYLMGAVKVDNEIGRTLMNIGRPICKLVFMLPKKYELGLFGSCMMWLLCLGSYGYATTKVILTNKVKSLKNTLLSKLKLITQDQ